jgi:hypothetical protein
MKKRTTSKVGRPKVGGVATTIRVEREQLAMADSIGEGILHGAKLNRHAVLRTALARGLEALQAEMEAKS